MTVPLEQLADQWDEGLPGSPEETCAMRACAAQLRESLRAQAEAGAGEIETLRQEHEALRVAGDARSGPIRRLRNRIYDLVSQLEAQQQANLYTPVIRQQVEELRVRATQYRAALAQADTGGDG